MLTQSKIISTALFMVWLLRHPLTHVQWAALVLLTVGVTQTQLHCGPAPPTTAQTEDITEYSMAVGATFLSCAISGFASVYQEKLIKTDESSLSLIDMNIVMALGGAKSCGRPVLWVAL